MSNVGGIEIVNLKTRYCRLAIPLLGEVGSDFALKQNFSSMPEDSNARYVRGLSQGSKEMHYISTRGEAAPKRFKEILLEGLAPDGGLYVPEWYPRFDLKALRALTDGEGSLRYADVALPVLSEFMDDIDPGALKRIIEETYTSATFGSEEVTPVWMLKHNVYLLRLAQGPTLAFKDVPLQLLGRLMEHVLAERGEELNVLGATSGDTGSAAAYALRGRKGLRLFMLSPHGRMSRFQERQMYTLQDPNIFNLSVSGTFDDCQAVVKAVNADADFKRKYKLGAVNSINWARIAAQVVYYVYAWLRIADSADEKVSFAVPSGNFGNALSAHVARQMGLPIHNIIVATNENDVLNEFFCTGVYRVRKGDEVKITSSPSMDIAAASNFERFMFDLVGRNPACVRAYWSYLQTAGQFSLHGIPYFTHGIPGMKSGSATDGEVLYAIRLAYKRYDFLIDPHTAVGLYVGLHNRGDHRIPLIVAETALPAKFEDTIEKAVGFKPPVPDSFADLEKLPERVMKIEANPDVVKQFIAAHV